MFLLALQVQVDLTWEELKSKSFNNQKRMHTKSDLKDASHLMKIHPKG